MYSFYSFFEYSFFAVTELFNSIFVSVSLVTVGASSPIRPQRYTNILFLRPLLL
jgi:hypothetical protein